MDLHSVSIVLINNDKQILGVSRKYDHTDMGLVGGKVDKEDFINLRFIPQDKNLHLMAALIKAAIRETKEETGLDIFDLEVIYSTNWDDRMQWTFLANWRGEIHTNEPHAVKWINTEILKQGGFWEYNKEVLKSLNTKGIFII